jgi:hypothetical protein
VRDGLAAGMAASTVSAWGFGSIRQAPREAGSADRSWGRVAHLSTERSGAAGFSCVTSSTVCVTSSLETRKSKLAGFL